MAFVVKDRVKVSSTTTGTGTFTLGAAPSGFQDFSVVGNGNTTSYAIVDNNTGAWEVGIGTYTASGTLLSRDTVLESSTGGAKINFAAGAKDVFVTYPAETSVTDLGISRPTIRPSLLLDFANTEALDPRITFARASAATYYGTETAKAEENLLLHSQAFDNAAWSKGVTSVTANTEVAPDGTTTAETLTATAGASFHIVNQTSASTTGTTRTFSLFAKKGTHDFVQLYFNADSTVFANFDLDAGTVGTVGSASTATITSVGSDWYRCVMTTSSVSANNVAVIAMITSGTAVRAESWTAAGTETIFLWGAQVEQRSAVTNYTPTTTQPITNYIPVLESAAAGEARFDHNPNTFESLGLLIEESRTNLLTFSEEFDNAGWVKARSSITANTVVSPDGTLTGDKLVENTETGTHRAVQTLAFVSGTTYTFSVYAKAAERGFVNLLVPSAAFGENLQANFNLTTGAVGTVVGATTASIQSAGNGWYRCSITVTATASSTQSAFIHIATSATGTSYQGDGFSGIFIWGASLEQGAFPTSYIPTVASQVTRAADAASMTGANFSSWYNQAEGTLYSDAITLAPIPGARAFASINDNTANNRWTSVVIDSAGPVIRPLRNTSGAGLLFTPAPAGAANTTQAGNKVALAITNYEASMCFNGGAAVTTTNTYLIPVVTQMQIGQQLNGSFLNGHLRKLSYYPKRLANAELQGITS